MASVDLIAVVGAAFFGGGVLVGAMLVIAAGIRAEGQLAWRRGTVTLRDDPASRMARGIRRINGVGLRTTVVPVTNVTPGTLVTSEEGGTQLTPGALARSADG